MTFREILETYQVTKGRLSQLTRGYKNSRTGKRVPPKLVYGKHWVRKNVEVPTTDGRDLEMNMPVFTEEGVEELKKMFEPKGKGK